MPLIKSKKLIAKMLVLLSFMVQTSRAADENQKDTKNVYNKFEELVARRKKAEADGQPKTNSKETEEAKPDSAAPEEKEKPKTAKPKKSKAKAAPKSDTVKAKNKKSENNKAEMVTPVSQEAKSPTESSSATLTAPAAAPVSKPTAPPAVSTNIKTIAHKMQ
jgi:hypothetical protein